jgi:hypothetical protein
MDEDHIDKVQEIGQAFSFPQSLVSLAGANIIVSA